MNRYIVAIHRIDDEDPLLFLVFADDFLDCCDLMDYVCDTYDFKWEDFSYDISFDMNL